MTADYTGLDELFTYGRHHQDFALFLSFIQVEYGLAYLKEQWESFLDFSAIVGDVSNFTVTEDTYREFSKALGELYLTNPG